MNVSNTKPSCSICLAEFKPENEKIFALKCSHSYHLMCIASWVLKYAGDSLQPCPMCKRKVTVSEVNYLKSSNVVITNYDSDEPVVENSLSPNSIASYDLMAEGDADRDSMPEDGISEDLLGEDLEYLLPAEVITESLNTKRNDDEKRRRQEENDNSALLKGIELSKKTVPENNAEKETDNLREAIALSLAESQDKTRKEASQGTNDKVVLLAETDLSEIAGCSGFVPSERYPPIRAGEAGVDFCGASKINSKRRFKGDQLPNDIFKFPRIDYRIDDGESPDTLYFWESPGNNQQVTALCNPACSTALLCGTPLGKRFTDIINTTATVPQRAYRLACAYIEYENSKSLAQDKRQFKTMFYSDDENPAAEKGKHPMGGKSKSKGVKTGVTFPGPSSKNSAVSDGVASGACESEVTSTE